MSRRHRHVKGSNHNAKHAPPPRTQVSLQGHQVHKSKGAVKRPRHTGATRALCKPRSMLMASFYTRGDNRGPCLSTAQAASALSTLLQLGRIDFMQRNDALLTGRHERMSLRTRTTMGTLGWGQPAVTALCRSPTTTIQLCFKRLRHGRDWSALSTLVIGVVVSRLASAACWKMVCIADRTVC
mmetsp:Transcript_35168/g.80465  ORF Transcript_35168/g.80465 Transcript_35168/m.80465 type:complete len:183 (-) Transcript_35168:54-602(-)